MAWYPGATRMELQPESDAQAAIKPTQLIFHSIAAPWTVQRIYEYWRDSTNLESHFGQDYNGKLGQFIGTETRADANAGANRRPDGTGAVSVETASNLKHTDPWTPEQVEGLIRLGVWMHQQHKIPLRICRSHSDPGYGYHAMFPEWSVGGTACPGEARIRQFREVVFPKIKARASSPIIVPEAEPMPTSMLREDNPVDVALPPDRSWLEIAFQDDSTIHAGPQAIDKVLVWLYAQAPSGVAVEAEFYECDPDGKNPSGHGVITWHGGGQQLLHVDDVPARRHLRVRVRATGPGAKLLHRRLRSDYWPAV